MRLVKPLLFALGLVVAATSLSLAQSLPNYGPNAPSTGDTFGKPPSGTNPPPRGYRAYAYRLHHHYRHRHWHHYR